MGSVPAISVLILGIVVPALSGYIEVCKSECLSGLFCAWSDFDQHAVQKKQMFSAYMLSSLQMRLLCLSPADVLTKRLFYLDVAVHFYKALTSPTQVAEFISLISINSVGIYIMLVFI